MSEDDLIQIAEGVARQRILVHNLGMMNRPDDVAERVRADARYMVENDKLRLLDDGYQAALRQCSWATQITSHGSGLESQPIEKE